MYQVYSQHIKNSAILATPHEQVSRIFQKIKDDLTQAFASFQNQAHKECFESMQSASNLAAELGNILSSRSEHEQDEAMVQLPNGQQMTIHGFWQTYFSSLIVDIFSLFPRFDLTHYDRVIESLDIMIERWRKAAPLH
jgi:hypothetical protein